MTLRLRDRANDLVQFEEENLVTIWMGDERDRTLPLKTDAIAPQLTDKPFAELSSVFLYSSVINSLKSLARFSQPSKKTRWFPVESSSTLLRW